MGDRYTPDTSSDGNHPRNEDEYLQLVAEFESWLNEELAKAWDESQNAYFNGIHENPYRKVDQ